MSHTTCAVRSPRVGDAMVCTFDDGGPAPTITGVIDPIGDLQIPITRLVVFDGRIVVLKNHEGLFLITEDRRSMEEEVFPEWRGVRIYARGACVWRGLLWIPTGNGLYAVGPGNAPAALGGLCRPPEGRAIRHCLAVARSATAGWLTSRAPGNRGAAPDAHRPTARSRSR